MNTSTMSPQTETVVYHSGPRQEAIAQKPLVRAYLNAEVRDQLVSGDVLAAPLWATTAQQAIDRAPNLVFTYSEEGFPFYCDCAMILRESD